ncbi:transcriptional regulator [Saccharomonospora sp. CUA-673]|uniref:TetR/AcrR family transcriptional regulator n=1 Tax=Saccharomonospora sp. CUA-673 TaxID=1904969 RepID=UPI000968C895|nr:TetR/AcrR family transcriptional regulator [Saccharomonospora sp. CUA-673]OLT46693.1 transcriptional regulator [Saccharomonospora sp. CUA-673]
MSDGVQGCERADARRNRRRIIDAALAAFGDSNGTASLESIARRAGVGIGTLYRHFPSREALIEAVYRDELGQLCDAADELRATLPPEKALRTWMGRYADFVATKHGMAEALRDVIASGAITSDETRTRLSEAVRGMLAAGADSGGLRDDVPAEDVVAQMAGVLLACQRPDQRPQIDRLLDLLMDGLSAGPG